LDLEKTENIFATKKDHIIKNSKSAITNSVIIDVNILNFIDNLI
jgi:hypothetical protein